MLSLSKHRWAKANERVLSPALALRRVQGDILSIIEKAKERCHAEPVEASAGKGQ